MTEKRRLCGIGCAMCAVFECLRLLCYGKSVTKLLPGQSGKNRSFEMADKIPYEVLLPVAVELFQKLPYPSVKDNEDNVIKVAEREKLASAFAIFYHKLHEELVNRQP